MSINFAQNLDCKKKGRKHLPSSYLYSFSILATSRLMNVSGLTKMLSTFRLASEMVQGRISLTSLERSM